MYCKTTDSRPLCRSPKELSILTISPRYVFSSSHIVFSSTFAFLALHETKGKSAKHGLRAEGCHKPAPQFLAMPCGMIRGALAALGFAATVHADVINIPACMSALVSPDCSELYPHVHLHHRGRWGTIARGDASAQSPAFSIPLQAPSKYAYSGWKRLADAQPLLRGSRQPHYTVPTLYYGTSTALRCTTLVRFP
jgi:hypothetical protein